MPRLAVTDRAMEIVDLPALTGTERQIAWANTIRGRFAYTGVNELVTGICLIDDRRPGLLPADWHHRLGEMLIPVFANVSAKWWIEHRYDRVRFWIGWYDRYDVAETVMGTALRIGQ